MSQPLRARAPISAQLVCLLLASLLAAHAVSVAVILLMPPPRPSVYHIVEVAAALRGGSLKAPDAPALSRSSAAALPAALGSEKARTGRGVVALADALGAPLQDVRLSHNAPPVLARWLHASRGPRPDSGGPLSPADTNRAAWEPPGRTPDWRGYGAPPVVGGFAAAWRRPDGVWTVVRSQPEPFPSPWQLRAALWLLAGFAVVAPAGYLFARRITAPLKRFAQAAETLGHDPTAPQMCLSGPAEIGAAAEAFNEMQARLRKYITDRTAMVGAISHDLRTPLARIRFKIEAAPPRVRESVLADVAQMEQMIADVLAFIRDEGQPRRREPLELLSLLECVVDDAATTGGDVSLDIGEPLTVVGDPVGLQRLFVNLVDNALKYGGEARLRLSEGAGMARVEIADRGPGLDPAQIEKVFEPFYRTDSSRNLDNGGVGLGLAIARATARAHAGEICLASSDNGLTAIVTLPLAGSDAAARTTAKHTASA